MTTATTTRPRVPQPPVKAPATPPRGAVQFTKPHANAGHRIVLYGPGGIGKTTLAASLPGPVAFFDLDESLGRLGLDVPTVEAATWADLRTALQADGWDGIKSIVIDTATKAEELCVEHTIASVPAKEQGKTFRAESIEDYGWGKGFGHSFDTFLLLLGDLDRHARAGRNVCLICHECTNTVPNPTGEDWLRYEPRLQNPKSGKASIRLRCKEWVDHVLCVLYDVATDRKGKGQGSGTRTLYRSETPACMAKSRTGCDPIVMDTDGDAVWGEIIR